MNSTLVSVVIPTYNRDKTLIRCVNSVINQTYKNLEIIIIDDGSTDNTKTIVESINDSRIRYIHQENLGAQVARNNGLKNANGYYIAFLDSDDNWADTFIEKSIEKFRSDDEIGCVYCQTGIYNQEGEIVKARNDVLEGWIYQKSLEQGYITSPTFLICKKECFDKIGEWDINLKSCQDDDICFRLAKEYKFGLIDEILGIFNTDGGNQITSNKIRYANGWWVLWQKYKDEVIKNCGKKTLVSHYLECEKLFKDLNDKKMERIILTEVIKLDFSLKILFKVVNTCFPIWNKKDKCKKIKNDECLQQKDKKSDYPANFPIRLSDNERKFLIKIFKNSNSYLEFGSGGSTFLALINSNIQKIYSVESDNNWLNYLREWKIISEAENKRLKFFYINIGETKEWGYPVDNSCKNLFPNYSKYVFKKSSNDYDLVFIDARFRVACLLQSVLNCKKDTKILIHDFNDRPEYHIILKYVDIVDTIDTMAMFKIKTNINYTELYNDYEIYKYITE